MPARSARWPALLLVGAALTGLLAGCGNGDGDGTSPAQKATGRFGNVYEGVCAASEAAAAGDAEEARRAFDDVHVGLHDLAAAVEREDRTAAARLLEAKQRVEAGGGPDDYDDLADAVAESVERTGGSAPDSCP